jgi:hypothetical protein
MRLLAALAAIVLTSLTLATDVHAAAKLTLRPSSSPPGRFITVIGHGFCPRPTCSRATIEITGVPVARDIRVSSSGSFQRRVKVPGLTRPDPVGVVATQRASDGSLRTVIAPLTIVMRIDASKASSQQSPTSTQSTTTPESPDQATSPPGTRKAATPIKELAPAIARTDPSAGESNLAATTTDDDSRTWIAVLAAIALLAAAATIAALRRARRAG